MWMLARRSAVSAMGFRLKDPIFDFVPLSIELRSPEPVPRPGDLGPLSSWHLAGGGRLTGCFRGNSLLAVGTSRRAANAANQVNRQAQINLSYAGTNCSQDGVTLHQMMGFSLCVDDLPDYTCIASRPFDFSKGP